MSQFDDLIQQAAQQYNVDPNLLRGVIQTESGGNPGIVSNAGAVGLMQIEPATAKQYGITGDLKDPKTNVFGGAQILSHLLDTSPDVTTALRRYQGGDDQKGWGPVNAAYPAKVFAAGGIGQPHAAASATLPGIPSSSAPINGAASSLSDDAVLSAFTGGSAAPESAAAGGAAAPASDDAIFAAFSKSLPASTGSAQAASAQIPATGAAPTSASQPGMLASFAAGLGHGFGETVLGAQQLLGKGAQALGDAVGSSGISGAGNWLVNDANSGVKNLDAQLAPYQSAHPVATGGGELAGSIAATAPLVIEAPVGAGLMGLAGRGAISGAAIGALSPVDPSNQNFWGDKALQAGVGAALGAAAPAAVAGAMGGGRYIGNAATSVVRPFTDAGRQSIANDIIGQVARGGPTALDLSQIVPGSTPTLAEATANPGIATLQRTIRDINPNPFAAQEQQNAAARLSQLQNALGSPQELDTAQAATRQIAGDLGGAIASNGVTPTPALNNVLSRPAMAAVLKDAEKAALNASGTNPFQAARDAIAAQRVAQFQAIAGSPGALDAARQARDTMANALYSQANSQTFPVDGALQSLLQRPSMQQAVARAQKLANETGQPLKVGVDLPAQTTQSTILNAQGQPAFSVTMPSSQASYSGRALNYIKMGLDDIISSGAQTGGIVGHEKSALNSTKDDLLNWMDVQSPIYQSARQTYAQMSGPINAMETLQGLNLTDASGAIVPSKIDSAIKSIQSAQGEPGINAAKSVTPQQLGALSALRDAVNSDRSAPIPSNLGPAAMGYIQSEITKALNSGKTLTPEVQSSLQQAQEELLNTLQKQNPQAIGARSNIPGTAAGDFMGPITLPQQAELQARSAQSLQLLQGMNLTDASGNVTLAKVQGALKALQKEGLMADPQKMAALVSVRDDLMRASNAGLGRSAGSSTAQNLATQQMMRSVLPGKLGALAGQLPTGTVGGALGGLAGYGIGGAPGAAVGGAIGARLGSGISALMNTHNEAIQNAVAKLLLNPSTAAAALNGTTSRALPFTASTGLQRLLYPAIVNGGVSSFSGAP